MRLLFIAMCIIGLTVPAHAQTKQITGSGYSGCVDKDYFMKIATYYAQGDAQAGQNALITGIVAGQCTLFETSETVYVMQKYGGIAKVRRSGETQEFWTMEDAVR